MIHVSGRTEWDGMRFHHATQNGSEAGVAYLSAPCQAQMNCPYTPTLLSCCIPAGLKKMGRLTVNALHATEAGSEELTLKRGLSGTSYSLPLAPFTYD